MRRRVCDGQIVPRTFGGFGSRPAARNRCWESVLALALRPLASVENRPGFPIGRRKPLQAVPASDSVKRTESGDRHSLSDGCCSRGGRARYGSTRRCDGNRCYPALSNSLAPGDPGCVSVVLPTFGSDVGKRVTRSSRSRFARCRRGLPASARSRRKPSTAQPPVLRLPATRLLDLNRGN